MRTKSTTTTPPLRSTGRAGKKTPRRSVVLRVAHFYFKKKNKRSQIQQYFTMSEITCQ